MNEIKKLNKLNYIHSWIERLNIKMCHFFPNWFIDSAEILINSPMSYFVDIEKLILKFIWGKEPE